MPKFALRYPFFIIMMCLVVLLVGVVNIASMPVDLFPKIDMPVVVVATFYNGMPPQQIEADITNTFERFFTLGANIDHSESRSLTGVSLIKIYFKPGTDPNAALSNIANLAMADLRRLPPIKLEAHNLSLNDVVDAVNSSNLILPAGDVRIGSKDYNIYANSQFPDAKAMNAMPLKSYGNSSVLVADVGKAEDSGALQYNIVRIDGQRSVYVPIFKQGGNSNTITIVNGMKAAVKRLVDIPESLKTAVVFDQSIFVKLAIKNLVKEASIGLILTGLMILIFLGSPRATFAVLLSIPLSALVCLILTKAMGGSINTMLLGGLALAFSRLIDDSVVVLESIFRFMEMGVPPREAAEQGGMEVSLAVLAATSTTSIVFFPVTFLSGVSRYIFTPLALGVVLSIFASYIFAMTVVPLFCATFVRVHHEEGGAHGGRISFFQRLVALFNARFQRMLERYERLAKQVLVRPAFTAAVILAAVALVILVLFPFLGRAYFPRTDPG